MSGTLAGALAYWHFVRFRENFDLSFVWQPSNKNTTAMFLPGITGAVKNFPLDGFPCSERNPRRRKPHPAHVTYSWAGYFGLLRAYRVHKHFTSSRPSGAMSDWF